MNTEKMAEKIAEMTPEKLRSTLLALLQIHNDDDRAHKNRLIENRALRACMEHLVSNRAVGVARLEFVPSLLGKEHYAVVVSVPHWPVEHETAFSAMVAKRLVRVLGDAFGIEATDGEPESFGREGDNEE